jgi:hypothetical protein
VLLMRQMSLRMLLGLGLCGGVLMLPSTGRGQVSNLGALVQMDGALVGLADDARVVRSEDDGASFTNLWTVTAPDALYGLAAEGEVVVAAGSAGLILRADFATNLTAWTEVQPGGVAGDLRGVAADGAGHWLAVGDAVLRSTNAALTWSAVSNAPADLQAVAWNGSAGRWIAVGGFVAGAAYTSTNGLDWTTSSVPVDADTLYALAVDPDGQVLTVGALGTALISTNGGLDFVDHPAWDYSEDFYAVVASGADRWLAGGQQGVLVMASSTGITSNLLSEAEATAAADVEAIALLESGTAAFIDGAGDVDVPPPAIPPFTLQWTTIGDGPGVTITNAAALVQYQLFTQTDLLDDGTRVDVDDAAVGPDLAGWPVSFTTNTLFWGVRAYVEGL